VVNFVAQAFPFRIKAQQFTGRADLDVYSAPEPACQGYLLLCRQPALRPARDAPCTL